MYEYSGEKISEITWRILSTEMALFNIISFSVISISLIFTATSGSPSDFPFTNENLNSMPDYYSTFNNNQLAAENVSNFENYLHHNHQNFHEADITRNPRVYLGPTIYSVNPIGDPHFQHAITHPWLEDVHVHPDDINYQRNWTIPNSVTTNLQSHVPSNGSNPAFRVPLRLGNEEDILKQYAEFSLRHNPDRSEFSTGHIHEPANWNVEHAPTFSQLDKPSSPRRRTKKLTNRNEGNKSRSRQLDKPSSSRRRTEGFANRDREHTPTISQLEEPSSSRKQRAGMRNDARLNLEKGGPSTFRISSGESSDDTEVHNTNVSSSSKQERSRKQNWKTFLRDPKGKNKDVIQVDDDEPKSLKPHPLLKVVEKYRAERLPPDPIWRVAPGERFNVAYNLIPMHRRADFVKDYILRKHDESSSSE